MTDFTSETTILTIEPSNPTVTFETGLQGADGQGLVAGGSTGQFLRKVSAADYDTEWATISGGGDLLAANNLSDLANAATGRINLGVQIGVNVQAYDANLPTWPATVDATEVGYLNGVTSAIQTQIDSKAATSHTHAASDVNSGTFADARIAQSNVTQHEAAINALNLTNAPAEANADVTDAVNIASSIVGVAGKTTPVDADTLPLIDSAASNALKELTWANLKATIKSYYDSVTATLTNKTIDGDNNTISNLDIGNEVDWAAIGDVTDRTAFASGDKILIFEAGVGMRKVDYDDLPGSGGGISNIVEDTTPQLGGGLDVNGQKIISTANADIDIEPNGTGNVLLGNLTFDADQSVGAGQDNYVLTYDHGAGVINLEALAGGGDALTTNPLSQFAATTSAQLAGVMSDETGSGALVFANSPTFVTPALGTPASGVATNLTGTAAGLTAGVASTVTVADESADTTCFPLFAISATGNLEPKSGSNLTFNSSTGILTATGFSGNLTGNVTGNADTVTTNANLTGHITSTGNVTVLGSFTKAQLDAAVSDDTILYDSECASLADVKALNQSVISGASPNFTTTNMTDATNKRFMSDAQETVVNNTSGTNTGDEVAATSGEINTGTDTSKYITPDALAGSIHGKAERQITAVEYTTDCEVGDGAAYFTCSELINGMNLVAVHARCITAGTTGTMDIQIHNVTDAVDVLSTKLTIDSGETGSDTAATAAVINSASDDADTNDLWRIDIDAVQTTAAKGLIITMIFELP
jgi:hypothetical protein